MTETAHSFWKYKDDDIVLQFKGLSRGGTIILSPVDGGIDWLVCSTLDLLRGFEPIEYTLGVADKTEQDRGMKYDADKPRMDLLVSGCPNALEAVASVLTFGAKKYAAHSWQTVPNGDERYLAAQLRHITAIQKGEQLDPESGMHHLAHAACNALFILELALRKQEGKA